MRHTTTIEDRLADLPLFAHLGRRRVQHLTRLMTAVNRRAGTALTVEGDAGSECMIIVDGRARSSATAAWWAPSDPATSSARSPRSTAGSARPRS